MFQAKNYYRSEKEILKNIKHPKKESVLKFTKELDNFLDLKDCLYTDVGKIKKDHKVFYFIVGNTTIVFTRSFDDLYELKKVCEDALIEQTSINQLALNTLRRFQKRKTT